MIPSTLARVAGSRRRFAAWRIVQLTAITLCAHAASVAEARGQVVGAARLIVRVTDSTLASIPDADVSIVEGLSHVLAHGVTDATGALTLSVPSGERQVVVRKLGYRRRAVFVSLTNAPHSVAVMLDRSVTTLAAVEVSAAGGMKYRSYHVGADEIAASSRPILDGLDVLQKIRPDMIDPRAKTPLNPCRPKQIFVNGLRQTHVPASDARTASFAQKREVTRAVAPWVGTSMLRPPPYVPRNTVEWLPADIVNVLSTIRPEHIEEINYRDCTEAADVDGLRASAVYVALKAGVRYEPGIGSTVAPSAPSSLMANRLVILGVFDQEGRPQVDVVVTDSATRTSVRTTETGTASLAFLAEGAHTLELRKKDRLLHTMRFEMRAELTPLTIVLPGP
jgi:hypothetical protein